MRGKTARYHNKDAIQCWKKQSLKDTKMHGRQGRTQYTRWQHHQVLLTLLSGGHTPMAMIYPCTLLTILAAVLRPPTASTLCKLSCEFFPLSTLIVCTLSDPTSGVIFAAQIPHDHAGPVLHVLAVVSDSKFFNQRENVEIVR